jgi:hypothetical protein
MMSAINICVVMLLVIRDRTDSVTEERRAVVARGAGAVRGVGGGSNCITSMVGAPTGTTLVDHVGRRKLMLWPSVCGMCGMGTVAGLLGPAGVQSTMRTNAGISFICEHHYLLIALGSPSSPLHGILQQWLDASAGPLSS